MSETDAAAGTADPPVRKFNPGLLQTDEEVMAQFVVRRHELDVVGEVLRSNIGAPSCQHVLVVAPRGRGKTMLLARAAAELRTDPEFAAHMLPVRFMEESQEVYDLAGFWLEALFHLAREVAADCPELSRELSETHAALSSRWREAGLEGAVRAAVLEAADRLGRRLVLMVENLQSLCKAVDEAFAWQLRGVLQSEPQIVLLASATSRFAGLEDAEAPFFELFRIVHLQPLGTEDCRRLWTAASGHDLDGREIRPLEILTGGNPRLLVVVATFARHRSFRRLMEELISLVDEHTEYFRGYLESLPKNERRVYVALVDLWRPSSTGEVAARARLDVRVASTMLGRLVDRGAAVAEPDGRGRRRLYAASERLFGIWYKLRRERDEAAVVEALIHFMSVFYDVGEVQRISTQLARGASESPAIYAGNEGAPTETQTWMDWRAKGSRALASMARGASGPAMEAFGAAYAVFQPRHGTAMGEMLRLVPALIAVGASECDLVAVLAGDDGKSEALRPLIVALRQRTGETVRAPAEVLQVAADLRTCIDERVANGPRSGFTLQPAQ